MTRPRGCLYRTVTDPVGTGWPWGVWGSSPDRNELPPGAPSCTRHWAPDSAVGGSGESPLRPGREASLDIPVPCNHSAAPELSGCRLLGLGCCQGHCILLTRSAYAPSYTSQTLATAPHAHALNRHGQPLTRTHSLACTDTAHLHQGHERVARRHAHTHTRAHSFQQAPWGVAGW